MSTTPHFTTNRRDFLKAAATLSVPLILPQSVFGANEKLNLAWVGIGGMGGGDLKNCARDHNIIALCDCDGGILEQKRQEYPGAKCYKDFRVMLAELGDTIDAVGVGTPDHTHFAPAYMAMNMGKHVYVQKPLAHSMYEVRTLQDLAATKGLVTQMGNQGHAFEGARLVKEWYEAGLIGEVKEIITWTDRPQAGYGFDGVIQTSFPNPQPIPEGLDWDLWMGPVTKDIGYSEQLHPQRWRPWWDFGCGGLGDIGCHTIDTPYWALDLGDPERVEVELQGEANPIYTPLGTVVTYTFPARGNRPAVDLKWYEGPTLPERPDGYDGEILPEGGMLMVGTDGGIYHRGMRPDSPRLYPQSKWEAYRSTPSMQVAKTLPRTKGIHHDWLHAIQRGGKSCSDFSYSAPLTNVILLGSLAIRTGKGLGWDAAHSVITNNDAAAQLAEIPVRQGWRAQDL